MPTARTLFVTDLMVRQALERGDSAAGRRHLLALTRLLHKAPPAARRRFLALKRQAAAMRELQRQIQNRPRRPRGRVRQGMVAPPPAPRRVRARRGPARSDCSRRSGARSTDSSDGPPDPQGPPIGDPPARTDRFGARR